MAPEETKHELAMKKLQMLLGILVGVVTLVVGVYNAKNLVFAKKGPGAVRVEVLAQNGQPVPHASLEVAKVQGGTVASAETGPDGKFSRQGLGEGNYNLKIAKAGFQPESLFFSFEPGGTAELNVKLKPASSSIQSAVEEVGASWIKQIGTPRQKPKEETPKEEQ